jgi:hypothetical protein
VRGFFLPKNGVYGMKKLTPLTNVPRKFFSYFSLSALATIYIAVSLFFLLQFSARLSMVESYFTMAQKEGSDYLNRDEQFKVAIFNTFEIHDKEISVLQAQVEQLKEKKDAKRKTL